MQVPLLDLKAQYATIRQEIEGPVLELIASQKFILGKVVEDFEADAARYCAVPHALGVSSGTDALLLALMALDIRPGDEVITSSYSFFATAGCIHRVGARPIFVDIDPATYNLEPAGVRSAITARTRALIPVHLFGQCASMQHLLEISEARGIPIVEDAAQAIGAEYCGRRAGGMGRIGCFSFFPSKNLGAFGDAGMVTTNDPALADRMKILRAHGAQPKYYHRVVGGNFRLDALQALVLHIKLRHLDDWTSGRQRVAGRYGELFRRSGLVGCGHVRLPEAREGRHIFNQFILRVQRRDALKSHLTAQGIGTEIYYPVPLHLQECFRYLGYAEGAFPESEAAARETLAIPTYAELTVEQQEHVVDAIRKFYASGSPTP
ncbi:MAG: DegT/DnrJ/EryC1/StrS family aminotransferase [Planctomycetes bacterium]|nr:DegT/DnrJ/EryC1/StrS family aminotransferase [Planctomycetota bacterium]